MLTAQELTDFFNAVGMDTPAKLEATLKPALVAAKVRQLEQQLTGVQAEQSAAMAPFNDRIRVIETERSAAIKPYQTQIAALRTQVAALSEQL